MQLCQTFLLANLIPKAAVDVKIMLKNSIAALVLVFISLFKILNVLNI